VSQSSKLKCRVEGSVAAGFERVRDLYQRNMATWAEENTQLCIYYRGEKVVDLWASATDDSSFGPDSLVNVFSSGKSLEAIAIASLVSKGLLSYDAKVADYWPEFGANNKEALSISEILRHEGGLANFDVSLKLEDLLADNIKQNRVGSIIEQQLQRFGLVDGNRREYHAITRGWILNEVFRRVDPAGRTIGEFLREDISRPLQADAFIGLKQEELARVSRVQTLGLGFQFLQGLVPKILGRKTVHNIFQILGRLLRMLPVIRKGLSQKYPPPYAGMKNISFFNKPEVAMGETPSANANCSARGLAKIAAMLAGGGRFAGRDYLSNEAWSDMHAAPVKKNMGDVLPTEFTQGGVAVFTACERRSPRLERDFNTGREGFYGWMGLGGSIFQWHPQWEIGFAFVPTSLHVLDILNERGKTYQAEVLRCIERMEGEPRSPHNQS